jgi:DNA-directed RNA polymerase subunit RPC12/RpoP
MNDRRIEIMYEYVCPTCGLTVGPYDYWHKLIECGNGCGNLLVPKVRYAAMVIKPRGTLENRAVQNGNLTWRKPDEKK